MKPLAAWRCGTCSSVYNTSRGKSEESLALTALETLRASGVVAVLKRASECMVLTSPRAGEVRAAEWAEIDIEDHVWTVPATRTKVKCEHREPLCRRYRSSTRPEALEPSK